MANQETKSAHTYLACAMYHRGKEYCGDSCRDAGSDDVEIACQCDHAACPLTIREFVSRLAAQVAN